MRVIKQNNIHHYRISVLSAAATRRQAAGSKHSHFEAPHALARVNAQRLDVDGLALNECALQQSLKHNIRPVAFNKRNNAEGQRMR